MQDREIYWMIRDQEQVPHHYDWLHPDEQTILSGFRFTKRRVDWLLGRWTAKSVVRHILQQAIPENKIEIRAADDGAPEVFINKQQTDINISISHSYGRSFCIGTRSKISVGCDMEKNVSRKENFIVDYFTDSELNTLAKQEYMDRSTLVNIMWCGKEAALKAIRTGLRRDTRTMEVQLVNEGVLNQWKSIRVLDLLEDRSFQAYYQIKQNFVFVWLCSIDSQDNAFVSEIIEIY